jgi:hypothetical protein
MSSIETYYEFLGPETYIKVQFLDPETAFMVQFLAPEIVIMGERNYINSQVSRLDMNNVQTGSNCNPPCPTMSYKVLPCLTVSNWINVVQLNPSGSTRIQQDPARSNWTQIFAMSLVYIANKHNKTSRDFI